MNSESQKTVAAIDLQPCHPPLWSLCVMQQGLQKKELSPHCLLNNTPHLFLKACTLCQGAVVRSRGIHFQRKNSLNNCTNMIVQEDLKLFGFPL